MAPERMMAREFTEYDDELDDGIRGRRRQGGVRVKLRGGMPRSRGGKIAAVLMILVLAGLGAAGAMVARNAVLHDERFMIPSASAIETEGNLHVARGELVSLFGEDIERNIFRVPLAQRKAELEELPWVERATVMRLLPNHIRVAVTERTPVAFVRQGNHIGLVDANGVLLDMPTEPQAKSHYSFPVVTGLEAKDPLSLRAARMKLYEKFTDDLNGEGEKVSEKLSEVDLSNPEDVRAVVQDKGGEVLVHFGQDSFLDRYKKFQEHLQEWRSQYPHLASVDMRYDRQVVLEMQPGTTASVVNDQQAAPDTGKSDAAPAADAAHTKSPAHSAKKPVSKGKKAASKKSKSSGRGAVEQRPVTTVSPAKAEGESFWVRPAAGRELAAGSRAQLKYDPQVVHP
ncbi:MAG TPA: FtsQ-type POTRA domain-containing protein [Edaphobacter sp.]|nr:FtsQ-type POTRA domain-containing protein [Edaphobacter sp.]